MWKRLLPLGWMIFFSFIFSANSLGQDFCQRRVRGLGSLPSYTFSSPLEFIESLKVALPPESQARESLHLIWQLLSQPDSAIQVQILRSFLGFPFQIKELALGIALAEIEQLAEAGDEVVKRGSAFVLGDYLEAYSEQEYQDAQLREEALQSLLGIAAQLPRDLADLIREKRDYFAPEIAEVLVQGFEKALELGNYQQALAYFDALAVSGFGTQTLDLKELRQEVLSLDKNRLLELAEKEKTLTAKEDEIVELSTWLHRLSSGLEILMRGGNIPRTKLLSLLGERKVGLLAISEKLWQAIPNLISSRELLQPDYFRETIYSLTEQIATLSTLLFKVNAIAKLLEQDLPEKKEALIGEETSALEELLVQLSWDEELPWINYTASFYLNNSLKEQNRVINSLELEGGIFTPAKQELFEQLDKKLQTISYPLLEHQDSDIWVLAADAILNLNPQAADQSIVDSLIVALHEPDPEIRALAVLHLTNLGLELGIDAFLWKRFNYLAQSDPDRIVRVLATRGLSKWLRNSLQSELAPYLEDILAELGLESP